MSANLPVPIGHDAAPTVVEPSENPGGAGEASTGHLDNGGLTPAERVAHAAAEVARLTVETAQLTAAVDLAGTTPGTDLLRACDAAPVQVKASLARARAHLARHQQRLLSAQQTLTSELEQQMQAAQAALAPLQETLEQLTEGIWTVNLYLGRDEDLVAVRDGQPAPAGTPITIRQAVLAMDEECALAAETGGIDVDSIEEFDAWIAADPANLQQVLPEPRGVVAIMPRRKDRDYGDPWVNAARNTENHQTWWLIRNGERLYRMLTDFNVGQRLVPRRDEFTAMFTERRFDLATRTHVTVPLEPGSSAWLKAEKVAGARERHYMRVALILQGLIDRTTVFHPLPAAAVSLLSPDAYDAGHVVLLADEENALGTGRQPFRAWLAERNAKLRPGMRIVGAFDWQHGWGQHRDSLQSERVHPRTARAPRSGVMYRLEGRRAGGLYFLYDRGETWVGRGYDSEHRAPRTRASCVVHAHDDFVIPLDLVTIEEMRDYLNARSERHAYADMFPVLKAAIAAKEDERAAEAPFVDLLALQISAAHGVDVETARAALPALVDWWKISNRWHRPLVAGADPTAEAKASRMIVAEYARRHRAAGLGDVQADAAQVTRLREQVPDAMLVARKRDGSWLVLAPQPRAVPEHSAPRDVFVREHSFSPAGRVRPVRDWVTYTTGQVARWDVLWSSPMWAAWQVDAVRAEHLTDPEIEDLAAWAVQQASQVCPDAVPLVVNYEEHRFEDAWTAPMRVFLDPRQDITWPAGLLTGKVERLEVLTVSVRWRRGGDGTVTGRIDRYPHPAAYRFSDHSDAPWRDGWADHRDLAVWTDPAAVEAAQEAAAAYAARVAERNRLYDDLHQLRIALEQAWLARAEEQAYARFLEDYAAPDLWEGHRKTLRLTYPHRGHAGLGVLLGRLLERDLPFAGLTVADALDLLPAEGAAVSVVPEDVLDLVLPARWVRTPREG